MTRYKKIIVCCSQGITGGPEVLHQLVDALRSYGHEANICYYPFDQPFECPEPYRRYNAPKTSLTDQSGTMIVIPETATWIVKNIRNATCAIWWLSVDNYFRRGGESSFRDFVVRWKTVLDGRRLPLLRLRHCMHLAQSFYAKAYLARWQISSQMLTDYLAAEHLQAKSPHNEKRNIVVYNPKKGASRTRALIRSNPNMEFIPIQNMNRQEVSTLLGAAKLYLDVGHHPGKDRLPREAALAGCCVITGRQGSARNADDVPIPEEYKIDDNSNAYIDQFRSIAESIFADFEHHSSRLEDYRRSILREPKNFLHQVREIFGVVQKKL